jgi:hypothetical protein
VDGPTVIVVVDRLGCVHLQIAVLSLERSKKDNTYQLNK